MLFSWDCCFKANLIRMICQVFKTANKASKHCRTTPYSLTCNWNTLKRIEIGGEAAFQEMIKKLTKIMKASKKPRELQYILLGNKSPQNVVAQKNQPFPFCRSEIHQWLCLMVLSPAVEKASKTEGQCLLGLSLSNHTLSLPSDSVC